MSTRKCPIVVGVGDIKNPSKKVEDAIEPLDLILQAIQSALKDTGLSESAVSTLQSNIDSVDIIRTWTWPYPDLSSLIVKRLAIKPRHRLYSEHGGDKPAKLFDEAARRISLGESTVAIVGGGEALASLTACANAKKLPPPNWTPVPETVSSVFSPTTRQLKQSASIAAWKAPRDPRSNNPDIGSQHSIGNPIQVYPLFENSFRAHQNQTFEANHAESVSMYTEFAKVAEGNEYAWFHGQGTETEESIGTAGGRNRMICWPYPLLMNAFNTVNLAAACILTSTEYARQLGIPEDRWIYPLGGAGTRDNNDFWERPEFWWSPSISRSLDASIEVSGIDKEEIDLFDFYSCFPIVPKLACAHLGLPTSKGSKPISLLGGLTSFGGAGNNYSMHAINEMVRQLRQNKGRIGLVLANGGVATYQAAICLSRSPRRDGLPYPRFNPLPPITTDVQVPPIAVEAEGDAVVETFTVVFNRDGTPLRGHVVGRLKSNGHRFLANHADESTLNELCSKEIEPIGRSGKVKRSDDGRNLFAFDIQLSRL